MAGPLERAVVSNATWCDTVCRAHGLSTSWAPDAWTVSRRTPDGYPDAVTLARQVDAGDVLGRVQAGPGGSVKDSYAELDLGPWGFHVLFEATWIHRAAPSSPVDPALDWHEARTPAELARWATDHDLDVFVPALLEVDGLHFFSAASSGASFALHASGSVVAASHVLAGSAPPRDVWSDLVAVAALAHPGVDLVGYELGADLDAALGTGFEAVGSLRVWMRS